MILNRKHLILLVMIPFLIMFLVMGIAWDITGMPGLWLAFAFVVTLGTLYRLLGWIDRSPRAPADRRKKVERLLRQLDDTDLDVLRAHLQSNPSDADGDESAYETMTDLLQTSKRKNG